MARVEYENKLNTNLVNLLTQAESRKQLIMFDQYLQHFHQQLYQYRSSAKYIPGQHRTRQLKHYKCISIQFLETKTTKKFPD